MSILRALNTSASGLRSHGEAIGVTSDNIANVNTVGFKRSRATFQDILGRSIGGTPAQPQAGGGSRLAHIEQMFSQGSLLTTDSATDLALAGGGFFVVQGSSGGFDGQFYTRAGQFTFAQDPTNSEISRLVNSDGMVVQGYSADVAGNIGSTLGDLTIPRGTVPSVPTANGALAVNLDATATVPAAFDPLNADTTSNFSTNLTVYDSLGSEHNLTTYFRKASAGNWEWFTMADGGELAGGTAGVPTQVGTGTLVFNTDGSLQSETGNAFTVDFLDATPGQAINFDFGTSIADGGTGFDGSTQFASPSTTNALIQDGFAAGSVTAVNIASDGTVFGTFSSGQQRALGQVAVAEFGDVQSLERAGMNLWAETIESGQALVGAPETGARGSVSAGTLEQSNVDLGQEFVNLISQQRGFQANSRVVTTADEMYGELVNLKR